MSKAWSKGSTRSWRELRQRVLARDGWTCAYCGREANQVDHITPKSAGGSDDMDNLTAACSACNLAKSDKPVFSTRRTPLTRSICSLSPNQINMPPSA